MLPSALSYCRGAEGASDNGSRTSPSQTSQGSQGQRMVRWIILKISDRVTWVLVLHCTICEVGTDIALLSQERHESCEDAGKGLWLSPSPVPKGWKALQAGSPKELPRPADLCGGVSSAQLLEKPAPTNTATHRRLKAACTTAPLLASLCPHLAFARQPRSGHLAKSAAMKDSQSKRFTGVKTKVVRPSNQIFI